MREVSKVARGEEASMFLPLGRLSEISDKLKINPTKCFVCRQDGAMNIAIVYGEHGDHWDEKRFGPMRQTANGSGILISICDVCNEKPDNEIASKAEAHDLEIRRNRG